MHRISHSPRSDDINNIVTHITIARQRLGKHVPEVTLSTMEENMLLGSGSLGMFLQQRIGVQ
jgi:hypothetical protein